MLSKKRSITDPTLTLDQYLSEAQTEMILRAGLAQFGFCVPNDAKLFWSTPWVDASATSQRRRGSGTSAKRPALKVTAIVPTDEHGTRSLIRPASFVSQTSIEDDDEEADIV